MKKAIWIGLLVVLLCCTGFLIFYGLYHAPFGRAHAAQTKQVLQSGQAQQAVPQPPQQQQNSSPQQAELFDQPLHKTVVDLGLSPSFDPKYNRHSELRCFYYKGFAVKELDMAELGDEWIAIAPDGNAEMPPCVQEHGKGEIVVQDWSGYLAGVKGNLIFLDAEDASNNGTPFGVFDAATGKKLFEDSASGDRSFLSKGKTLVVRYERVEEAGCSIPLKKEMCWRQIEQKGELGSQAMPACDGYPGGANEDDPSVVSYPVEVTFEPKITVRALPGTVGCWAAE